MLQTIPNSFHLASFIQSSTIQEIQLEKDVHIAQVSFSKNLQDTYALAISNNYICFGMIEQNQIAFVCTISLSKDLRFQKIFKNQQFKSFIIGFKLIYQNQMLEIYFKSKHYIEKCIERLSKKVTQFGFHEQFRPIKKIGKGGFATVYEVKRAFDGKSFAVKAFSKASAFSTPSNKATLQNEINILKALDQENLLRLFEVFESTNSLYLVMEIYEGGDLVTLIRRNNANFPTEDTKSFMYDLLKGLNYLETLKIMHRDIKPENIMIRKKDGQNELIIGDFGLASYTELPKYLLQRCGTPGYVAPQIANFKTGDRVTSKCDIFSLGVIFHILLCRTHLFNGNNCDEVYKKNKNMQFNLNHDKYKELDSQALELLRKMLHEDPFQRVSAQEALRDKYFQGLNQSKLEGTPKTVVCQSQSMLDANEDAMAIRERLFFY